MHGVPTTQPLDVSNRCWWARRCSAAA